jgi:exodeoxyribonuclease VII small subunit
MSDTPPRSRRKEEGPSFEVALARLEAIIEKLDDGNLPLAQALALYKEGNALAKRCRTLLTEAEVEVKEALASDKASET